MSIETMPAQPPISAQDAGFAEWAKTVTAVMERHGKNFAALPPDETNKHIATLRNEVAKLSDEVESEAETMRKRMVQLAAAWQAGASFGGAPNRARLKALGAMTLAVMRPGEAAQRLLKDSIAGFEAMDFSSATGAAGKLAIPETIFEGIANRLPAYGKFELDCPPRPCGQVGRMLSWADAFQVFFPDIGEAPEFSDGALGGVAIEPKRWSVATLIDRWLLSEALLVPLGQLIEEGMARAFAKKTDDVGFFGDGTQASLRVPGAFYWTTGDSDKDLVLDAQSGDTSTEKCANRPHHTWLGAIGAMSEEYADDGEQAFYMHRTMFFRSIGARDVNDKPYADIRLTDPVNRYVLYGIPVRFVRQAPRLNEYATPGVTFAVLANLRAAYVLARNPTGITFERLQEIRRLQGQEVLLMEALQQIGPVNRDAIVQIRTAAA